MVDNRWDSLDYCHKKMNTWCVGGRPRILWGLELRSINIFSMFPSFSVLFSGVGSAETRWFTTSSFPPRVGLWEGSLLASPRFSLCDPGSSELPLPGLSPGNYRNQANKRNKGSRPCLLGTKGNQCPSFTTTNLNSLPQQKISSMGSFATNVDNHIALQTKGSSIDLTVKESYIQRCPWSGFAFLKYEDKR